MEIDIISYSPSQYAVLTSEQLLQIKEAQVKKNNLLRKLEEQLQREKERLVENGMVHSGVWTALEQKLRAECETEVAWVRETLLFYLRYSVANGVADAPYTVDFSLSYTQRLTVVKNYYMSAYSDPIERFDAYKKDSVAMKYLEEYYSLLYDYFDDDI